MTVFLLENGCYSDTHVVGVFSTHEAAELASRVFADDPSIQAFELDSQVEEMRRGAVPYFVRLSRATGDVLDVYRSTSSYGAFSSRVGVDVNRDLHTTAWATCDEHAIKIAADRRRMFLASEPPPAVDAVDPHVAK